MFSRGLFPKVVESRHCAVKGYKGKPEVTCLTASSFGFSFFRHIKEKKTLYHNYFCYLPMSDIFK